MTRRSALLAFALLIAVARVEGQDEPELRRCAARGTPIDLTLARLTYHEEGNGSLDGAGALFDTIATLAAATGRTWIQTACRYSRRLWSGRTARAPWILGLDGGDRAPRGWPSTSSWAEEGPTFAALLAHSTRVVSGEVSSPCEIGPHDWGGLPEDGARIDRGVRRGWWAVVDCGPNVHGVYLARCHFAPGFCADRE